MLKQTLLKIPCDSSVMDHLIRLTHEDINVNELFHLAGLPSRSLWSAVRKVKTSRPPSLRYGVPASAFSAALQSEGWFAETAPER
jgi:hypothetical protein